MAQQRRLADPGPPVDADRQRRGDGGGCRGGVLAAVEEAAHGARALTDRQRPQSHRRLLLRGGEEDHRAVVGMDLDVLVADRDLAADTALDECLDRR